MSDSYPDFDRLIPLSSVPAGWTFARATDGWFPADPHRTYAPRHEYEMLADRRARDIADGRIWRTNEDMGLDNGTAVRIRYRLRGTAEAISA